MQAQAITTPYLTPKALALRWHITTHTLEQWRWKGHGPQFMKLGSCIRYPRAEIEKFEDDTDQITMVDVRDERFLCIRFESILREKEEMGMSP
ncbi:MAG: helix-turn-helix domain-containing protein [Alphaproteobacteria bacterium]|nr:helix-turn-helix domain-containing protein [Alphaproteobacteria bacterium]